MIATTLFLAPLLQGATALEPAGIAKFAPRRVEITNVGLATRVNNTGILWAGDRAVFLADEDDTVDLNGDRDFFDEIVMAYDTGTGQTLSSGAQPDIFRVFTAEGDHVAVGSTEGGLGLDVTSDGDLDDDVLVVLDLVSGQSSPLPFALSENHWLHDDGVVAFGVNEIGQGAVNFNSDLDYQDTVMFAYDTASGVTTNTGYAVDSNFLTDWDQIGGGYLAFHVKEEDQGYSDLTGDGDKTDQMLVLHDLALGAAELLPDSERGLAVTDGPFLYHVREDHEGVGEDLDGNGSISGLVLHRYDPGTGVITNLAVATSGVVRRSEGRAVVGVLESSTGTDLNGDGDASDEVLHLVNEADASFTNLGVAVIGADYGFDEGVLYVAVSEAAQNDELNGDPDHQDDVLHVLGNGETELVNLGLDGFPAVFGGVRPLGFLAKAKGRKMLPFLANENANQEDLDGSGGIAGNVLQIYHLSNGQVVNTGIRSGTGFFRTAGDLVYLSILESQVSEDLNGDGDTSDFVLHAYFPIKNELLNLGVATAGDFNAQGRRVATSVPEDAQGDTDLNGDGDTNDDVLHVIEING